MPHNLTSLSFRWTNYLVNSKNFRKALKNLKNLSISFTSNECDDPSQICLSVLRNCPNLVKLSMHSPQFKSHCNFQLNSTSAKPSKGDELCFPKLSDLQLDMDAHLLFKQKFINLIRELLRNGKSLKRVHLGFLSSQFIESYSEIENSLIPIVFHETMDGICLDFSYTGRSVTDIDNKSLSGITSTPLVWKNRLTANLKKVSLRNLEFVSLAATASIIAISCPFLEELNLSGCQIRVQDMANAMKVIAENFPELSNLNLAIAKVCNKTDEYCDQIANSIAALKKLRVLHLSTDILKNGCCSEKSYNIISKDSELCKPRPIEDGNPLCKIIDNCSKIEEFYFSDFEISPCSFARENVLAYISNWTNVKKLHFNQLPTNGAFMEKVFKRCRQLEEFYFCSALYTSCSRFLNPQNWDRFLRIFKSATSLKTLSIAHLLNNLDFIQLMDSLIYCTNLQRIYVSYCVMDIHIFHNIADKILSIPKLRYFGIHHTAISKRDVESTISIVCNVRPEFTFECSNRFSAQPLPITHYELARYETNAPYNR
ncbi:hypothetical protein CHUAL_010931 [Chamberlinius hualienensis]